MPLSAVVRLTVKGFKGRSNCNLGLIVDIMLECSKHSAKLELVSRISLRGRTNLIEELSAQAEVIYGAVEPGQWIQQATVILIVEDICALVRVLEKIVENEGACLLDEF